MNSLFKFLIVSVACLFASPSLGDEGRFGVPLNTSLLVKQGRNECGPASLFNSLSLASDPIRASLNQLPGLSPREKYSSLLATIAAQRSAFEDQSRFDADSGGTNEEELYFMAKAILNENFSVHPWGIHLVRRINEADGSLLQRTYGYILRSLRGGLPPILLLRRVDWDITSKDAFGNSIPPEGHYDVNPAGHFVVVFGVAMDSSNKTMHLKVFNPYFREDDLAISESVNLDQAPTVLSNFQKEEIDYASDAELPHYKYQEVETPIYRPNGKGHNAPHLVVESSTFSIGPEPNSVATDPVNEWPSSSWWAQVHAPLPTNGPRYYYALISLIGLR